MRTIALVGCGRDKLGHPAPAAELYRGDLFRKARRYAESFDAWFILSAKHGLVEPERILEPYDVQMRDLPLLVRETWGARVASRLLSLFPGQAETQLTVLAGAVYADALSGVLPCNWTIDEPLRGLGIGQRKAWLRERLLP